MIFFQKIKIPFTINLNDPIFWGSTNHRKGPKRAEKGRKGPKGTEKDRKEPKKTKNDQK